MPIALNLLEAMEKAIIQGNERIAFCFHGENHGDEMSISYNMLGLRAKAVAAILQEQCAEGDRVLLLLPPGLDYIIAFTACIYAKVIAVPTYLPVTDDLAEKLQLIINDAKPRICLTNLEVQQQLKNLKIFQWLNTIPLLSHYLNVSKNKKIRQAQTLRKLNFDDLTWISIDKIADYHSSQWRRPKILSQDIAFLQYTSGTTHNPKGVMVSHGNLVSNIESIAHSYQITKEDIVSSWLPPYHDMGLIGTILTPFCIGFMAHLMSPLSFLKHPYRWLKMVSTYQVTIISAPNFSYELCCNKITDEQATQLNLSCLRVALNGAETVLPQTIQRFNQKFSSCGFKLEAFAPVYGLAEATLLVSAKSIREIPKIISLDPEQLEQGKVNLCENFDNSKKIVCLGKKITDIEIIIVNPKTLAIVKENEIGEIWLQGASVTLGYWQKEKETQEVFHAYLSNGEGPYLRTGDLGFFYQNELYMTGRIKDLIIINGKNYYPYDIEKTIEQCSDLIKTGGSAVFSVERNDSEFAIAIAELHQNIPKEEALSLSQHIRKEVLKKQGVELYDILLTPEKSILKTTSGKKKRPSMKDLYLKGNLANYFQLHPPKDHV